MTWVKLDDGFHDDEAIIEAGLAGAGLMALAMSWCGKKNSDGCITKAVLSQMGGTKKLIAHMVRLRLFVEVDDRTIQLRSWLKYNPTGAEVRASERAKHEKKSAAATLGNHVRWHRDRPSEACPHCFPDAIANPSHSDRKRSPRPDPTRPESPYRDLDTQDRPDQDSDVGLSRLVTDAINLAIEAEKASRDFTRPITRPASWAMGYRNNTLTERRTEIAEWLERNPNGTARALAVEVLNANPLYLPSAEAS